jgi:type IV pilus assembly protein PilO
MEVAAETQAKLESLTKLPQAARIGILGGIGVLIACVYFFGFFQSASEELKRLQAQELGLQRKLSEVRSVASNISAFETEIGDLKVQLKTALRQLPNEKELEVLLTDINNLGKQVGVEIQSFKLKSEVVHDFYAEVPIEIVLIGEYHDIGQFFDQMAKLKRIVNMGAIRIGINSENVDATILKVSGTATTFRFVGANGGA